MSSSFKLNSLLVLVSILLSLLIAEAAIRVLAPQKKIIPSSRTQWVAMPELVWTEPHPALGWYHQKSKKAILKKDPLSIEINTNAAGFRGNRDYQKEKPSGTVRTLILGDSFAFGWGVLDGETFGAQLENQVENMEALNLGVAGYGIDQIYLSFSEIGKEYQPDFVFITIFPEDFWRATRAFTDVGYGKPFFKLNRANVLTLNNVPVRSPEEMGFEQFPEIIEHGYMETWFLNTATYRYLKKKTLRLARDLGWVDPDLTEEWRLGQAILKKLLREVRERGAKPLLVIVPPERWMGNTKPDSIQKSLARFAAREREELLDLTPHFIKASRRFGVNQFYIKGDNHWTADGHKFVSDLLIQYLKTQGLSVKTRGI